MCVCNQMAKLILIAKPFQNKHIGRRVICELVKLAGEKDMKELYAVIYSFNTQSQKMFESIGFQKVEEEKYKFILQYKENYYALPGKN